MVFVLTLAIIRHHLFWLHFSWYWFLCTFLKSFQLLWSDMWCSFDRRSPAYYTLVMDLCHVTGTDE